MFILLNLFQQLRVMFLIDLFTQHSYIVLYYLATWSASPRIVLRQPGKKQGLDRSNFDQSKGFQGHSILLPAERGRLSPWTNATHLDNTLWLVPFYLTHSKLVPGCYRYMLIAQAQDNSYLPKFGPN
jgi:hypothetical protein